MCVCLDQSIPHLQHWLFHLHYHGFSVITCPSCSSMHAHCVGLSHLWSARAPLNSTGNGSTFLLSFLCFSFSLPPPPLLFGQQRAEGERLGCVESILCWCAMLVRNACKNWCAMLVCDASVNWCAMMVCDACMWKLECDVNVNWCAMLESDASVNWCAMLVCDASVNWCVVLM